MQPNEIPNGYKLLNGVPIDSRMVIPSMNQLNFKIPTPVRYDGLAFYVEDEEKYYHFKGGVLDSDVTLLFSEIGTRTVTVDLFENTALPIVHNLGSESLIVMVADSSGVIPVSWSLGNGVDANTKSTSISIVPTRSSENAIVSIIAIPPSTEEAALVPIYNSLSVLTYNLNDLILGGGDIIPVDVGGTETEYTINNSNINFRGVSILLTNTAGEEIPLSYKRANNGELVIRLSNGDTENYMQLNIAFRDKNAATQAQNRVSEHTITPTTLSSSPIGDSDGNVIVSSLGGSLYQVEFQLAGLNARASMARVYDSTGVEYNYVSRVFLNDTIQIQVNVLEDNSILSVTY